MGKPEIAAMAPMGERYQRPDWVRRINAMGDSVGRDGARRLVTLDADELLEMAGRGLGEPPFGDFGEPGWRTTFAELVQQLDAAPMNVLGRLMTRQELLRALRTRLLLARRWDETPAIADETILAPLVVTGPPRSGTTILFELLSLDPGLRAPPFWEALHPTPPPDLDGDPRPTITECESELWHDIQPETVALHEWRSDLPAECLTLTAPSFCSSHWSMISGAATPNDPVIGYAFEKRLLQTLQADEPGRTWLLKTPGHLMTIDLLFETFPDAWIVQTHRDPAKTMPSTVSMTAAVQWLRTDEVDLQKLAAGIAAGFSWALNSVAARRTAGDLPNRFADVHFQSLMKDPVETLRRAYGAMSREFTDEHADRITRYLADKPQGKFGVHRYTPEEWGFTSQELRDGLASYIDTFGIALENQEASNA